MEIYYPEEYPFKSPKVKFMTPIFHPDIQDGMLGEGCFVDLLLYDPPAGKWSPAFMTDKILNELETMLECKEICCEEWNPEVKYLFFDERETFN